MLLYTMRVSPSDLAKKLDESRQTVSNWLDRGIPGSKMFAVAEALGMTVEDLRPYMSVDAPSNAEKILVSEVDAFLDRIQKLPVSERQYVLKKIMEIPFEGDD